MARRPFARLKVSLALLDIVAVLVLAAIYQEAQNDFRVIPLGTLGRNIIIANGVTDLGTFGGNSRAVAIDATGAVLGWSETASGDTHAFIWTPEQDMTDLGKLPKNAWVVSMSFSGHILCNMPHHASWWERAWNYLGNKQLLPEKFRLKNFSETYSEAILLELKPKAQARLDAARQRHR